MLLLISNSVTPIKYHVDNLFGAPARLIIVHPNVEMPQELIIKGGEAIIVTRDGRIKFSTNSKIVPIDAEGRDLDKK